MEKKLEVYRVKIQGKRPLLMHKIPQELGRKGRSGEKPDPKEDAEKAIYRDRDGKIIFPAFNVKSAMSRAAREYTVPGKGKRTFKDLVKAGILIEPQDIPLKIPDGSDPEKSWEIDLRPVVVQRARIIRARPRFDNWELEFNVSILDSIIKQDNVKNFITDAGKYNGLGDFRPEFGLFEVVEFEKAK